MQAEQRMQRSAWRPSSSARHGGTAVIDEDDVHVLRTVTGVTPVHMEV